MKHAQKQINLTEGTIWKQMLRFSLPILFGNLFQQTYNMVDSAIVGHFVGDNALAAVGSSANIIMLLLSAFYGISMGAGVVISHSYGAKDFKSMEAQIHTMVVFGILGGLLFTVLGEVFTPHILRMIDTPEEVMGQSAIYFRVFFTGTLFSALYNIGGGILRAVGDSKRPLYYLIASCLINVMLDLLFVAVLHWGVAGAAAATVISQFGSCILTFHALMEKGTMYQVSIKKLKLHKRELKKIISIGLPSGVQNSIVSLSNIVVQASINSFGAMALAGYGCYCKIDGFVLMPSSAFAMATTTFVSQNIGAGKYARVKRGALTGLLMNLLVSESIGGLLFLFAPYMLQVFTTDPGIISYGVLQARTISLFYFMCAGTHALAGILRGGGQSTLPMLIIVLFWCGLRMSWITFVARPLHVINYVFWAYPLTWLCTFVILGLYCWRSGWLKKAMMNER